MSDVLLVLIVILGVVLVWRGPKNLPKLGEALGRGIRAARDEAKGDDDKAKPSDPTGPAA